MSKRLKPIKGRVFADGESVRIDGHHFSDCKFLDCVVEYAGGPFRFTGSDTRAAPRVPAVQIMLDGTAATAVDFLLQLGVTDLTPFVPVPSAGEPTN